MRVCVFVCLYIKNKKFHVEKILQHNLSKMRKKPLTYLPPPLSVIRYICSWSCVFITKFQIKYNVPFFIQNLSADDESHLFVYKHTHTHTHCSSCLLSRAFYTQIHHKVQFALILIWKKREKEREKKRAKILSCRDDCMLPLNGVMWKLRRLYRQYKIWSIYSHSYSRSHLLAWKPHSVPNM